MTIQACKLTKSKFERFWKTGQTRQIEPKLSLLQVDLLWTFFFDEGSFGIKKNSNKQNVLAQCLSSFWYPCTPKSKLNHFPYPKIKTGPFYQLPDQILKRKQTKMVLFLVYLKICLPLENCSITPRDTRTPGWEPLF